MSDTNKVFELPTLEECNWVVNILRERNKNLDAVPLAQTLQAAILVWQGQRGGMSTVQQCVEHIQGMSRDDLVALRQEANDTFGEDTQLVLPDDDDCVRECVVIAARDAKIKLLLEALTEAKRILIDKNEFEAAAKLSKVLRPSIETMLSLGNWNVYDETPNVETE